VCGRAFGTDDGTPVPEFGGTGSEDLLVDGSSTPVDYFVSASATTDVFIQSMIFRLQGNGIKLNNFGAKNSPLTNGVEVEVKSDNIITTFPLLRNTADFKNRWAALSGTAATWDLAAEPGADEFLAIVAFENPFVLKIQGNFGDVGNPGTGDDDYIRVKVQDDLSSGNSMFDFLSRGFEKEP